MRFTMPSGSVSPRCPSISGRFWMDETGWRRLNPKRKELSMKPFAYYKITSVAQAVSLLSKHQQKAAILAGGSDLLGMMKDRLEGPKMKMPEFLIDIKGI